MKYLTLTQSYLKKYPNTIPNSAGGYCVPDSILFNKRKFFESIETGQIQ